MLLLISNVIKTGVSKGGISMTHYLVIHDWAQGIHGDTLDIKGIAHSLEEAKQIFKEHVAESKEVAKEGSYIIYDDNDVIFDAGAENYYLNKHEKLYILMVHLIQVGGLNHEL
jgi:ATP-dependent protease ClpP protease subunit